MLRALILVVATGKKVLTVFLYSIHCIILLLESRHRPTGERCSQYSYSTITFAFVIYVLMKDS